MLDDVKRMLVNMTILSLLVSAVPAYAERNAPAEEDAADTVGRYDRVITGGMEELSGRSVTVDGKEFPLCRGVLAFSINGEAVPLEDIKAAEEIAVHYDMLKHCVRKIRALKIAR